MFSALKVRIRVTQAMTSTIVDEPEVPDDSERVFTMATNTFEALHILILHRIANAKLAEGIEPISEEELLKVQIASWRIALKKEKNSSLMFSSRTNGNFLDGTLQCSF